MNNRLYRSRTDSTIAGVCGGLGEYFNIDPTIMRILFVLFVFLDGVSLLAYVIAWIIIPRQPLAVVENDISGPQPETVQAREKEYPSWNKYLPGGILIGIGVFFFLREHYWWWHMGQFWPLLLIGIGIFLLLKFSREKKAEEKSNHDFEGGAHESGKV